MIKPYFETDLGKLYCDNCLRVLLDMPNESIDLTVTSPPYDNLRTYKGYRFNFEGIANELYRVTKNGGVVVWVVNDQTIKGSETGTSFKQVLFFKEIGFNLHDTMVYAKNNYVPLTHNRYEQQFEYTFILSKDKVKTFNPIKKQCSYAGRVKNLSYVCATTKEKNSAIRSGQERQVIYNEEKIIPNIWFYTVGAAHSTRDKIAFNHPAIFPEKLAEDHIISWSNPGDIVLDPMAGSGTVLKMAERYKRKWIGIEISRDYCSIVVNRLIKETCQIG